MQLKGKCGFQRIFIHTVISGVGYAHGILVSYFLNIINPEDENLLIFCFGCITQNSESDDKSQIHHEGLSGPPLWIREINPGNQRRVTTSSQWGKSSIPQTKSEEATNKVINYFSPWICR